MINTELHNTLIDQQVQKSIIASERLRIREQRALKQEQILSYLPLVGMIFLILLLLIILLWLLPTKSFSFSSGNGSHSQKSVREEKSVPTQPILKQEQKTVAPSTHSKEGVLKDGVEYVKHDHHVYKRTWRAGQLVSDERLEESIEDSRTKKNEQIPQLATPKKGNVGF